MTPNISNMMLIALPFLLAGVLSYYNIELAQENRDLKRELKERDHRIRNLILTINSVTKPNC